MDRHMPSVAVFFGLVPSPILSRHDIERLEHLLTDGALIIPVVADTGRFSTLVPPQIAGLNGISLADCGTDFECLAARILEGFGLLRESRRLFISYRRIQTSGVAAQLYEALDAAGFDVFLDTHGVLRPGEPFQDILWHRLADTDVAVLLDSPDFLASRWTEEELARANASNIQILQVLWPGQVEGATAAFSSFHPLTPEDFEGDGDARSRGTTAGPLRTGNRRRSGGTESERHGGTACVPRARICSRGAESGALGTHDIRADPHCFCTESVFRARFPPRQCCV